LNAEPKTVPKPNLGRSKTLGLRVKDKKTIMQWGTDGTLKEFKVNPLPTEDDDNTNTDKDTLLKKSKFGSLQNSNIGGGAKSVRSGFSTATTEVAFSNYEYPKAEDQEDGAVLMKVRGKPGISKKNLIIIPLITFMLMFTGVDVL
jgi:hypothetical protein